MKRPILSALSLCFLLVAARAPAARAADEEPAVGTEAGGEATGEVVPTAPAPTPPPAPTPAAEPSVLDTYYPPPVDGPELRLPESPTRLYLDAGYASSDDLAALQLIQGSGSNVRIALGGALRWHRFSFEGEIPFVQVTTLDVTHLMGNTTPIPQDAHQTGVSFGDARVGAIWTERLAGERLVGGFGLRTRLATHTTSFTFHLTTGGTITDPFPYYFHVEPTAILGGALGRFIFVINEGIDLLWGPNGDIPMQGGDVIIVVPTIVFWDSHVALSYAPWDVLGVSVELGTDVQVNNVNDPQFPIQNIRSAWVAPAIQLHFGDWRVDLIGRLGLGGLAHGTDAFGVLEYVGTNSYTLRVGRSFN